MEAGTVSPGAVNAHIVSTGSRTIADLMGLAAQRFADKPAARFKRDGAWQDLSYQELGEAVSEIGRGLLDLGVALGDRVAILCDTRVEWTMADFGISSAGGCVVPIYPTNSPAECEWVLGNSESRLVFCENAAQVAKVREVQHDLPALEGVIQLTGEPAAGDDALTLEALRERGRARAASELTERTAQVSREDLFTIIYTSGTTGPPKGCVTTHGNYRDTIDMCERIDVVRPDDLTYLFLPLAHSYALLVQLVALDLGTTLVYFGGDTKQVVAELMEAKPTYLPSVPRIFEKVYTLAQGAIQAQGPEKVAQVKQAIALGGKVRDLQAAGQEVPEALRAPFEKADAELFVNVRNLFGGRLRQAISGAAPIAPEILEFFWACGVPVLEGYGMTETSTCSTYSTVENHRFGTVGRALPGCEARIADDGELLVKGPNVFRGYWKMEDTAFGAIEDGWLLTGDLASIDADGYVKITGRKKDIIITAGGKNLTPANAENMLKQSRYISQAVMHGDRRPFPVALITLDPDEIVPWAQQQGIEDVSLAALARDPRVHALIQGVLDEVNAQFAQVEQIKKFFIPDHDLSQETGELTPTLKVKRNVVNDKFAGDFEALYPA